MDRTRIANEVIEILANKLHQLPQPPPPHEDLGDEEPFDYENQKLIPDITSNHLDIAEVSMDLEDAFGVNFDDSLPGSEGMETIGKVIDYINGKVHTLRAGAGRD